MRQSSDGFKVIPRTSLSQEDLDALPPVAKAAKGQPDTDDVHVSSDSDSDVKTGPTLNGELQVNRTSNFF